ncbi:MAG: helix-turn-helix transcriptional regulator [Melioribacteraceae bacterium]
MTIGEKIRFFAENSIGSVAKLAELLGMKPPSLYVYLNNESIPGGDILRKLKDLGCDINWLLSDDDRPPPETIYEKRIKELEEEIRILRDRISQIALLTQEVEKAKKIKLKSTSTSTSS